MANSQRLTALTISHLTQTGGYYRDGKGLMLLIDASGDKSWGFAYASTGMRRDVDLIFLADTGAAPRLHGTRRHAPRHHKTRPDTF